MAHQGKCDKCRVHFVWERDFYLPFRNSRFTCPSCGGELRATTYKCRYPISRVEPTLQNEQRVG